jgi:hypothetical protein
LERAGRQRRTREVFAVPVDDKENEAKAAKKKNATKKPKVEKKEKPAKVTTKAEKTNKSKKRKKAVTNDASEVQSVQESHSIPKYIQIPLLSPERVSASAHFTSPLTQSGVEARPKRQYMLSNEAVEPQQGELCTPPCSPASSAKSSAKKPRGRESPISRVKTLGRGDFVETKKTKGACTEAAHGPRVKVTLREVYDDHWQKASEFVKDVVTDSKAKQPSPSKKEEEPSKAPELPEVDERHSAFLSVFNILLQNNDGTIEEEGLLAAINELSAQRVKNGMVFAEADVDQILLHLCEENKIMRCDGQVYSI